MPVVCLYVSTWRAVEHCDCSSNFFKDSVTKENNVLPKDTWYSLSALTEEYVRTADSAGVIVTIWHKSKHSYEVPQVRRYLKEYLIYFLYVSMIRLYILTMFIVLH